MIAPRTRRAALGMLLVAALVALSGCGLVRGALDDRMPSTAASAPALPTGSSTHDLTVDGLAREFRLYVPASLPAGPAPLVVMLHGGYGSAAQAERGYGWDELADREGVVIAYPDGDGRAWNAGGGCCGQPARDDLDDVAFVTAVVARVEAAVRIDPARVFATGMSNGAMMSYRLACESTLFAAIGPVAGTRPQGYDCASPEPVSVMAVHGDADDRVRYEGGVSTVGSAHIDATPQLQLNEFWRKLDGCGEPAETETPPLRTRTAQCDEGRGVTLVTVQGYGHEWPGSVTGGGGEPVYDGWDATAALWDFFAAHPKP